MMTRREILFALAASMLTPFQTAAQQQSGGHKFRIGYIGNSTAEQEADMLHGFRRGLSERERRQQPQELAPVHSGLTSPFCSA